MVSVMIVGEEKIFMYSLCNDNWGNNYLFGYSAGKERNEE